jgi:DNA repair photolyase
MNAIYAPTGRAAEYSPLACNLYWGCNHACRYCYAPGVLRRKPEEFHASVRPRGNILAKLEKDARAIEGDPRQILLSFLCDPYPTALAVNCGTSKVESGTSHVQLPTFNVSSPTSHAPLSTFHVQRPTSHDVTRDALRILERHHLNATILTKGGIRAARDFDILEAKGWTFGTSLVWWRDPVRAMHEPNAACVGSRVGAIRIAKRMGIKTWVSLEPVIDLQEALLVISNLAEEVDSWWIGPLNHAARPYSAGEWAEFKGAAEILLQGKNHTFKKETWTTNP